MILPTKHIPVDQTLLALGAILLPHLEQPCTVSGLWEKVKRSSAIGNFERFVLTLDMLYIIGIVRFSDEMLERTSL